MASNSPALAGSRAGGGVRTLSQPAVGLLALLVTLAVGFVLSFSVGPVKATLVLGPLTTIWLPFLVMNAVWWRAWPGSGLSQPWAALVNLGLQLVLIAAGTALLGQLVIGSVNPAEMFGPPFRMFPFLMPMAALTFGVMLHLTFITGQWPFRHLEYRLAGVAALVTSWVVGGLLYLLFCNWNPLPPAALGGMPNPRGLFFAMDTTSAAVWVIAWQMVLGVLLGGWPMRLIKNTAASLLASTATVLVLGVLSNLLLGVAVGGPAVVALAATTVFATFVWAMAMETWPLQGPMSTGRALGRLVLVGLTSPLWYFVLNGIAQATATWPQELPSQLYVGIGSLNFFAAIIVLYYTIFHRWPFTPPSPPPPAG